MSHGPSTFGSMITSSLSPIAATISVTSSRSQGELSALTRVQKSGRAEIDRLGHLDHAGARGLLGVGRDRVFEIAEDDIDLRAISGTLARTFSMMRRHEMDHALEPHRQFAQAARARRSPAA